MCGPVTVSELGLAFSGGAWASGLAGAGSSSEANLQAREFGYFQNLALEIHPIAKI